MPKARCPDCDAAGRPEHEVLRNIQTSGVKIVGGPLGDRGTAQYWIIEHHGDGQGNLCQGSGKRI